jgi:hydroxyacylglutathione hydrolase
MRQIRADLWETAPYSPFAGLTTHAYLWTPLDHRSASRDNVLLYAPGTDDELDAIDALGGVADQYLSHRDEAGPMLKQIEARFGARLHASVAEAGDVGHYAVPDVLFDTRRVDTNGIEVIPTPGHSPGSTCFLVPGAAGSYLFTGDTIYRAAGGTWTAGYIPGVSDRAALASTLELLATLTPDLVVSSAFAGDTGAHEMRDRDWDESVAEALATLRD